MKTTSTIDDTRITHHGPDEARDGDVVVYWMSRNQRVHQNPSLELAVQRANELDQPLRVVFALTEKYPWSNTRNFRFMLEGLREVEEDLSEREIPFAVLRGEPDEALDAVVGNASWLVCDRTYLRHENGWSQRVRRAFDGPIDVVESDVVVPVRVVSDKREYAARTIRPKLHEHLDDYLVELEETTLERIDAPEVDGLDLSDLDELMATFDLDEVPPVTSLFTGGTSRARERFESFLESEYARYDEERTSPGDSVVSHLSPYLNHGQISPTWLVARIKSEKSSSDAREEFIEELVVRRELAYNFVEFESDYDSLECLPDWALETLREHEDDERPHRYTRSELEAGETHDEAWNAAMRELRETGYMHNYMRMYWGKQIIRWTNTVDYARELALDFNNTYFLDGRHPASFANVLWLFGLHDRAFGEREVFGKVRPMSYDSLTSKKDIESYRERVDERVERVS